MKRLRATSRDQNGGYILVAVLSVMLLLTGLTAAASVFVRSALRSARLGDEDVAMAGLKQGGLEIVAYQLFVLKLPPDLIDGRRVRFAEATILPNVVDEAAKVDLNGADPRLLQGLLVNVGLDEGTATTVVTQIVALRGDPPGQAPGASPSQAAASPQAPGGAAPPTDQKPKLRGIQSIDALRDIPDLTRSDFKALWDVVTVYNPDGKIDLLTASEQVLNAIPGLTPPKIADILSRRQDADKETRESLMKMVGDSSAFVKIKPGPAFWTKIETTAPSGRRQIVEAVITASKSPTDPFYTLDWRE